MITGMHVLIYSPQDAEVRAFFRDVLELRHVDAGHGWLIFQGPPAEIAVHPAEGAPHHEVYLICHDIHATVAELKKKGVEFSSDIREQSWGLSTAIRLPGGSDLGLYQPKHPTAFASAGSR
jgi:glyoxalase/bleomycin resistance protein/dioxygenase superfamily protein